MMLIIAQIVERDGGDSDLGREVVHPRLLLLQLLCLHHSPRAYSGLSEVGGHSRVTVLHVPLPHCPCLLRYDSLHDRDGDFAFGRLQTESAFEVVDCHDQVSIGLS